MSVDVAADDCPARECFWITERETSHGGVHSSRRCEARCGRRDQTGCPPRREGEAAKWFKSRGVWKEKPAPAKASGKKHQAHCRAGLGFVCSCVTAPSTTEPFV